MIVEDPPQKNEITLRGKRVAEQGDGEIREIGVGRKRGEKEKEEGQERSAHTTRKRTELTGEIRDGPGQAG